MAKKEWLTAEEVYEKKLRNKKFVISTYIVLTIFLTALITILLGQ